MRSKAIPVQDTLSPSQSRSPKEASRTRIAITGYAAIASKERIAPSRTTQLRMVRTFKEKEALLLRQRPMPLQPNGADKWNEATEEAKAARRVRMDQRAPAGLSPQAGDRCGVGARADPPKRPREARTRNADTQRTVEILVGRARVGTSCAACACLEPAKGNTQVFAGHSCKRHHASMESIVTTLTCNPTTNQDALQPSGGSHRTRQGDTRDNQAGNRHQLQGDVAEERKELDAPSHACALPLRHDVHAEQATQPHGALQQRYIQVGYQTGHMAPDEVKSKGATVVTLHQGH